MPGDGSPPAKRRFLRPTGSASDEVTARGARAERDVLFDDYTEEGFAETRVDYKAKKAGKKITGSVSHMTNGSLTDDPWDWYSKDIGTRDKLSGDQELALWQRLEE